MRALVIGIGEQGLQVAAGVAGLVRTVAVVPQDVKSHRLAQVGSAIALTKPHGLHLAGEFAAAMEELLTDTKEDAARALQFDIWLTGSLAEPFFREHVATVAAVLTALAATRFASVFHGDGINRIPSLIPAAVCPNPRSLTEDERSSIVEVLQQLERLSVAPPERAPWVPIIPRFLLMENTGEQGMISQEAQISSLQDLIRAGVGSGLRQAPAFRNLLGFSAGREDFLSIITLASLKIPMESVRDFCVGRLLTEVCDALLGSSSLSELQPEDENLPPLVTAEALQDRYLHADGQHALQTCDENLPRFAPWTYPVPQDTPSPPVFLPEKKRSRNPLTEQRAYLPALSGTEEPEVLEGYFDGAWAGFPGQIFQRTEREVFLPFCHRRAGELRKMVDDVSEKSLEPLLSHFEKSIEHTPLLSLSRSWHERIHGAMVRERGKARLDQALGRPWDFRAFHKLLDTLRLAIACQMPRSGILLATLTLAIALVPAFLGLLPDPGRWATRLVPFLKRFYVSSGLDPSERIAAGVPAAVLAVTLALAVAAWFAWSRRSAQAAHLRDLTRSPQPWLAQLEGDEGESFVREQAPTRRAGRFLWKKAHEAIAEPGPISVALEQERAAFHEYWRSRCLLMARHEVSRTLAAIATPVARCDQELEGLVAWLSALRTRMQRRAEHALAHHPGGWPSAQMLPGLLDFHFHSHNAHEFATRFWADCRPRENWRNPAALESSAERWATQCFPFLTEGFQGLSGLEPDLSEALASFLDGLPARLAGGRYVRHRAYLDPDKQIEQTDVILIVPQALASRIHRMLAGDLGVQVLPSSREKSCMTGLRHVRDVSLGTFAAVLEIPWVPLPLPQAHEDVSTTESEDPYALLRQMIPLQRRAS